MSIQHAQAYIAELYDFRFKDYGTSESAYARAYQEYRTGERDRKPGSGHQSVSPKRKRQIRERIDRELAR